MNPACLWRTHILGARRSEAAPPQSAAGRMGPSRAPRPEMSPGSRGSCRSPPPVTPRNPEDRRGHRAGHSAGSGEENPCPTSLCQEDAGRGSLDRGDETVRAGSDRSQRDCPVLGTRSALRQTHPPGPGLASPEDAGGMRRAAPCQPGGRLGRRQVPWTPSFARRSWRLGYPKASVSSRTSFVSGRRGAPRRSWRICATAGCSTSPSSPTRGSCWWVPAGPSPGGRGHCG